MKILWLTPKWTLPANDGARVASYKLLSNLSKHNLSIDYLALSHPDDNENIEAIENELRLKNAYYIKRTLPLDTLGKAIYYLFQAIVHPLVPLTISSFRSRKIKSFISNLLSHEEYDYIVADGLHCLGPIKNFEKNKIIYRSHNVEADIWKKASQDTKNLLKKVALFYQYLLMLRFEKKVLRNSYMTLPISSDDEIIFEKTISKEKMQVTPIGMTFENLPSSNLLGDKVQFLFLGRLDWPPNKDGLKWFLDKVYPKLNLQKVHLHIAGSGNRDWLKSYYSLEGITFHGYVDSISELYKKIDCCIIPIFYGSGTRIKVIEATSYAKPMISTAMGALGSTLEPGVDYERCEKEDEWAESMNNYQQEKHYHLSQNAIKKLKKTYDEKEIAQKLFDTLS